MKEQDLYEELNSIKSIMERSTKFISLSGLSGVLAGIYALIGAYLAYDIIYNQLGNEMWSPILWLTDEASLCLILIAITVLIASLVSGFFLSNRRSKKLGQSFWNAGSRRLFGNLAVPLLTGGLLLLVLIYHGNYQFIAPICLIFYGLALVSGSQFTYSDVKYLGYLEIVLGLLCALMPGNGLVFWAIGFGVLHILYGSIMHLKYKQ